MRTGLDTGEGRSRHPEYIGIEIVSVDDIDLIVSQITRANSDVWDWLGFRQPQRFLSTTNADLSSS